MTAGTAQRPVRTPGVRQRMVRYWIVLATVRHILQDRRFQETVIVGAIGVVALAQVGRDNQARPVRRAASVTTRFHPHPHRPPRLRETSVERLRSLTVLQSPFLQLFSVRIHKRNLLKPRVVICSYNDHCSAPFSRALVGWHHQSLIGRGSRHCYGINFTNNRVVSVIAAGFDS